MWGETMSQNLWITVIAVAVYLTSAVGGKNSPPPPAPSTPPPIQQPATNGTTKTVSVSREAVSLRENRAAGSQILATLPKGVRLSVEQDEGDWYKVRTDDGKVGWVARWMTQPASATTTRPSSSFEVVGYYAENNRNDTRAYASLAKNLDKITAVAPFFYRADGYGNISGNHNNNLMKLAKSNNIKTLALVHNIQSDNFSSTAISKLLNSPSARSRAVNGILRLLQEQGYSGVNIDFEGVPSKDRAKLTAFFRELSSVLRPKGLLVTASLPAKTRDDPRSSWSGAYDYAAIAPYLDQVMIMTYDQHYRNGPPGPVASQNWVEQVISYTVKNFPANRVLMGIAAYGYDWTSKSGRALNFNAIDQLIKKHKIVPKWHSTHQVPHFTYYASGVRHEVWYENQHSTAAKLRIAEKYKIGGVAIWRLGYEDPGIWRLF